MMACEKNPKLVNVFEFFQRSSKGVVNDVRNCEFTRSLSHTLSNRADRNFNGVARIGVRHETIQSFFAVPKLLHIFF